MSTKTVLRSGLVALALASSALVPVAMAQPTPKGPAGPALKLTVAPPVGPAQGGPVRPLYGNISGFWGNIGGFWGNISGFYGNIGGFYGNISGFYGNISGFYGNISGFSGSTLPSWGNISGFSGQVDPFWGNISGFSGGLGAYTGKSAVDYGQLGTFWNGISSQWSVASANWKTLGAYGPGTKGGYSALSGQLSDIVSKSSVFWGKSVTLRTGLSFDAGYAQPMLSKWGIDLASPQSLAALTPDQQNRFIMAWYDGLMEFTGTDHVDHWMPEVNWTPALSQVQGSGSNTVIGLLDFTVKDAPDIQDNVIAQGGISTYSVGHGAAVASLMVAGHDGTGVMGIAPRASVVEYNPFDSTGTAGWADITKGMVMLANNNASIINGSLGVPGYALSPDWNGVLNDKTLQAAAKNTVLVLAAGNEGATQSGGVAWDKHNIPLIVVGSVDPSLNISSFSNRPGSTCLTVGGKCTGDYLMNHFMVASGENMLVSDDKGGFTRMSGTSFAAPLVSGAIALLQDRWPWLVQHPTDTTYIVLNSAKDLGAPGPDPVYGMGLLDVAASQSPLDWSKLTFWSLTNNKLTQTSVSALKDPLQQATWEASSAYVYGYEKLPESYRDFAIPLSSKLVGQSVLGATGQLEELQYYLTGSFSTWLSSQPGTGPTTGGPAPKIGKLAMMDFSPSANAAALGDYGPLQLTASATPHAAEPGWKSSRLGFNTAVALTTQNKMSGLKFGYGNGAAALGGATGLHMQSDYDPIRGGANPLLGFASGGAYGGLDLGVAPGLRLSAGMTSRASKRDLDSLIGANHLAAFRVGDYRASAVRLGMTWRATSRLQLSGGWTRLNEPNALLGVQSTDPSDLGHGSTSQGVDVGADLDLGHGFTASASGMIGKVSATGASFSQNLTVAPGGLNTSSFEISLAKSRLFSAQDQLRLSVSRPLTIDGGKLQYSGVQVIDRDTGEVGQVTQTFDPRQTVRPLVAEMLYGRSAFGGAGRIGMFGRAETRGVDAQGHTAAAFMAGAGLHLSF